MGMLPLSPFVHASPEVRARMRKVYLKQVPSAGFDDYHGYKRRKNHTGEEHEHRKLIMHELRSADPGNPGCRPD